MRTIKRSSRSERHKPPRGRNSGGSRGIMKAMAFDKSCRLALFSVTLLAVPLSAGPAPTAKAEDVGISSERLMRIGEMVQRHMSVHQVAGAVTLVARRGRIAHFEAHGYMDLESK